MPPPSDSCVPPALVVDGTRPGTKQDLLIRRPAPYCNGKPRVWCCFALSAQRSMDFKSLYSDTGDQAHAMRLK